MKPGQMSTGLSGLPLELSHQQSTFSIYYSLPPQQMKGRASDLTGWQVRDVDCVFFPQFSPFKLEAIIVWGDFVLLEF